MNREQYDNAKAQCADAILLFRIGDFYEFFFEDAEYASRALGLTLTTRDPPGYPRIAMCGVPYHCIEPYIAKLVSQGKRVAVCERVVETGKLSPPIERTLPDARKRAAKLWADEFFAAKKPKSAANKALAVIVGTENIRDFLAENDPMALKQAQGALTPGKSYIDFLGK